MSGANTHMNEHPSGGTRGGASVEPTPANNVGGGRGWGDSGFFKGGTGGEGTGHISDKIKTSLSSADEFSSLRDQKGMAESNFMDRRNREMGEHEGTCATEDHSFMTQKPGGSDTLPGWEKAKGVLGNMFG
ncbi:hypothetical protein F9C07_2126779 [Aspergillus flavus]|uniref:Uncharacterized protein n=4 Tax=Aspergillus subgen. Circumdati TaxID=2720871 RepID=A0A7U2QRJ7_ASPFN|nr:hypothetical protein BDV35DRAFT_121316 [Aspergillus flavus]KAF7631861.1 hypothetical protein AFLA_012710 [Aspergillus flavus NRRL3357]KOC14325.1 hypothetical protein AFLA70_47g003750 [Aspergillus flavus AF70]OOO04643.1 hypothetical protein OAory_01109800 [Aspergillus oryzae]QRD81747.1 hypothetical protein F9C07_2126779 [Aspergillus flavus]